MLRGWQRVVGCCEAFSSECRVMLSELSGTSSFAGDSTFMQAASMCARGAHDLCRFYEDAVKLCSEAKAPKLIAEIQRLRQWLTKHQDENLSDAGKQKLLAACETYFKVAVARDATFESPECEAVQNLISDLLKLPEGKLIRSAGGKSKAMKWLEVSQSRTPNKIGSGNSACAVSVSRWTVADLSHKNTLQLIAGSCDSELSDEVRDDVLVEDPAIVLRIRRCLGAGGGVELELDSNDKIVSVHCSDE
jgi:hypothetical protein